MSDLCIWGRFRKRNLKHAKECSIQQRRGFACGVCRWKRRFGCSRNSAVSAARFESGFRERDGQGQHWRGPHSHGGFLKMIVCESGGHANGLTYFIFRFLRRPLIAFSLARVRGNTPVLPFISLFSCNYSGFLIPGYYSWKRNIPFFSFNSFSCDENRGCVRCMTILRLKNNQPWRVIYAG